MAPSTPKSILFLGATGGVGLSALKHSLAAGHTCIAIQRTPSRLLAKLSPSEQKAVTIHEGNAHDTALVARALVNHNTPGKLVDSIIFSIGAKPTFSLSKGFGADDWEVCEKGMKALLSALETARSPSSGGLTGNPRIVAVSSTGITTLKRDVPLAFLFLYHVLLKKPHKDKRAMEQALIESGEAFTVVRASLLTDGAEGGMVRVGIEDPLAKTVDSSAVGYTISRADVGLWIYENVIEGRDGERFVKRAATLTY